MTRGPLWTQKEIDLLLLWDKNGFSIPRITHLLNAMFGRSRTEAAVNSYLYYLKKKIERGKSIKFAIGEMDGEKKKEILSKLIATDEDEALALIDDTIRDMIQDKTIGEGDVEAVRTILTWMSLGREKALEISEEYVHNLEENGFIKGGMFVKGEEDDLATWFVLTIAGAQGYIAQCDAEESV